jgi:hypothetical protein
MQPGGTSYRACRCGWLGPCRPEEEAAGDINVGPNLQETEAWKLSKWKDIADQKQWGALVVTDMLGCHWTAQANSKSPTPEQEVLRELVLVIIQVETSTSWLLIFNSRPWNLS